MSRKEKLFSFANVFFSGMAEDEPEFKPEKKLQNAAFYQKFTNLLFVSLFNFISIIDFLKLMNFRNLPKNICLSKSIPIAKN